MKHPKVIRTFANGTNQGQSERSSNVDSPKLKNGKDYVVVAALPLRSVPSTDLKNDCKKSIASHDEDDLVGQEVASNSRAFEIFDAVMAQARECVATSKRNSASYEAVLAQARECIGTSNKNSASNGTYSVEPKTLIDAKGDKRVAGNIVAESVLRQKNENLPNKRMKVENGVADLVQEKKSSRSESNYSEEDVSILTPAEWNMWELLSERQSNGVKASKQEPESELEKMSSHRFIGKQKNIVHPQAKVIVDPMGVCYFEQILGDSDGELDETSSGEEHQESSHTGSDEEPGYYEKQKELINLSIVQRDQPQAVKVREALKLFEEQYTELLHKTGKGLNYIHFDAARCVKAKGMWNYPGQPFGHIPGIEVGDKFRFRAELAVVGLHRQLVSGIDYVVLDGKKYATSVVNSGRYENKAQALDVLIYSGQGGNLKIGNKAVDQKLERGNLALVNSMEMGYPVRVTHKMKSWVSSKSSNFNDESNLIYTYDGLYTIKSYWEQRHQNHKMVFKFELHRLSDQPGPRQSVGKSRESIVRKEVCMIEDVSDGKEKMHIHAMNAVDNERPSPFVYITKIVYPDWFKPIDPVGCECVDGCSDSQLCPCVLKNGGEIPFNEKGAIIKAKPLVHECGPSCKCPPTCMNRVTQHGPQYQLELFKTKSRGWGIRSRNYITSGNFICEYVGELLQDKEAEQRIGNDEYLFDISDGNDEDGPGEFKGFRDSKPDDDGFAIDAAKYGNIGRFINHSCSPNVYAQEVLYDHNDKRMPHIMFFATKNIPPQQELTYDYNYKIDKVCDVNGNIKKKDCYCGSRKCTGRMY